MPPDQRHPLDGRAAGIMTLLCLIWGLQQVLLKAAAPDVTPLLQIAIRSGVAAVLVVAFMLIRGIPLATPEKPHAAGLGVGLLFALEFLLVGEGLRLTSASHMVVLLYTAPIFVALGLHWKLPAERLNALQWLGMGIAFAGLGLAFFTPASVASETLWGDFLGLCAGMAWGATTVTVRISPLARSPAALTLLYQLAGGFVILLPAAYLLGQMSLRPTPIALGSLVFQSLIVSFLSYLTWFWLLTRYLASRLGVFSFLTPLFGVAFGVLLLDEPLSGRFLAGSTLVLAGVLLVSGHRWLADLLRPR